MARQKLSDNRAKAKRTENEPTFAVGLIVTLVAASTVFAVFSGAISPGIALSLALGGLFAWLCSAAIFRARIAALKSRAKSAEHVARQSADDVETMRDDAWELRESIERYRGLIEATGDVVMRRDRSGAITYVNEAWVATFGDALEAAGASVFASDDGRADVTAGGSGETPRDMLVKTVHGDRWFSWLDLPMRDDANNVVEIQSVGRDITERKDIEMALRHARDAAEGANKAKSRFLATVSHEIRTPLNGILGMASLLENSDLTDEQQNYTTAVRTSGDALLSLINDILDFSKIEAGYFDLSPGETDLRELVEGVAELLATKAHDKGLAIGTHIGAAVPDRVHVDGARLRQVLLNLAGNGIKFTDTGGVEITVRAATEKETTGDTVGITFSVRDTGIGLCVEDARRVFGEFEQVDQPGGRSDGTGLGLAISKRLVELMGGSIAVESAPGNGSTFSFTVRMTAMAPARAASRLDGRNIEILAPGIEADCLARELRGVGATVTTASEPRGADPDRPEVAIDTLLIDADLFDDPSEIAGMFDDRRISRRIVLIRPGNRSRLETLRQSGFDAYLVRPVRASSLLRIVTEPQASVDGFASDPADERRKASAIDHPSGRRVLIAEDNPINAMLVRAILERLGHSTALVENGRDAVAAVDAAAAEGVPFDLVLMDLRMPVLDGIGATRKIRSCGHGGMPIVALTANAVQNERDICAKAGFTDYMTKPVDPDHLAIMIDRWIDGEDVAVNFH